MLKAKLMVNTFKTNKQTVLREWAMDRLWRNKLVKLGKCSELTATTLETKMPTVLGPKYVAAIKIAVGACFYRSQCCNLPFLTLKL